MKTHHKISLLSIVLAVAACHSVNETATGNRAGQAPANNDSSQQASVAEPEDRLEEGVVSSLEKKAEQDASGALTRTQPAVKPAVAARQMLVAPGVHPPMYQLPVQDRENYQHFDDNSLKLTAEQPVSTFSIDVDTGSYSNVRRFLNQGQLPRQDAVRVEELINYFNYGYETPNNVETPFTVYTELAPSPWRSDSLLLQIGLKGYEIPRDQLPPANLVFLIDVSGSMRSADKIGLLKQGFKLLTKQLRPQDTISIAVYAGASGTVLEPTPGDQKAKILAAIDQLQAGGSTNGAAGIQLAYQLAQQSFKEKGINRVVLATDGDFNVGTVNFEALKDMVATKRESGVALTTLGFGSGNYNDHLMEQLADSGNGNYAYIDNLQEARKVLVEEMGSTLQTIAKDVKIQVEFNSKSVASYRLIGYENRALKREDFNNDKVDAGDIGAGHTVTAIYELDLVKNGHHRIDPLRYGKQDKVKTDAKAEGFSDELAFLKLRYKRPDESKSRLLQQPILASDQLARFDQASEGFRFAATVAAFGQMLRGGTYTGDMDYDAVVKLGLAAKGRDEWGYRSEFINLVRLADTIAK